MTSSGCSPPRVRSRARRSATRRSCRPCAGGSSSTCSTSPRRAPRRRSSSPRSASPPTRSRSSRRGSSVEKGESLKDTALTLSAYEPDVIVIRHPQIGAPQLVANLTAAHVVNAGDGKHQHPTQALLDLYAIQEALGRLEGVHVAIVGDVLHSRVARSLIQALRLVGARVTLVGPPPLIPARAGRGLPRHRVDQGRRRRLRPADAARADGGGRQLRANAARVHGPLGHHAGPAAARPEGDAPGPDEPRRRDRPARRRLRRGLVVDQVRAGLVVRMAVLYDLLTTGPVAVESVVEVA